MKKLCSYSTLGRLFVVTGFSVAAGSALAEPYVGITGLYNFAQSFSNITITENLQYPNSPAPGYSFPNTNVNNISAGSTFGAGIKGGYFFEDAPFFGIEAAFNWSKINIGAQNTTMSNPAFSSVGQPTTVVESAYGTSGNLYQLAVNGVLRAKNVMDTPFTPFIGIGPTFNSMKLTGTGYSGIVVSPYTSSGTSGPEINTTSNTVGFNAQAGLLVGLTEGIKVGIEYRYNWMPINMSNYRSAQNLNANYQSSTVGVSLIKSF